MNRITLAAIVLLSIALSAAGYNLYHQIKTNGELSATIEQRDKSITELTASRDQLDKSLIARDATIRANRGNANEMQKLITSLRSDVAINRCLDLALPAEFIDRLQRATSDQHKAVGSTDAGL